MVDIPAVAQERSSPGQLIGFALLRAALLLVALLVAETTLRTATGTESFASSVTWSAEMLTRWGRLLPLAAPLAFIDLLITTLAHASPAGALRVATATRWLLALCNTTVALRITALYLLTVVALLPLIRKEFQLVYPAAAACAAVVLPIASGLELWWLSHRGRTAAPSALGRGVWVTLLLFLACGAAPLVELPHLGAAATLIAAVPFARSLPITRLATRPLLFAAAALMIVGILVDQRNPALRRFSAVTTPYSALVLSAQGAFADLDGDGSSHWWGLDCDGLDPNRGPLLADVPDDGIDQNCTGSDGSLASAQARLQARSQEREPEAANTTKPDIFLITMDALRADTFANRELLPQLNRWADGCLRFSNARSNANFTGSALVSLHTAMFPRHILTDDYSWAFDLASPAQGKLSTPPTLAAVLSLKGYATVVVFPPFHVDNFQFLTGYQGGGTLPATEDASFPPYTVTLEHIAQYRSQLPENQPVHLRAHFMDLHAPYREGANYAGYLRTAAKLDEALAQFLSALPADAIVVFSADHGEAFGEHGTFHHGRQLFDEELRVPLVVCAPARFGLGKARVVDSIVGLVDVMPTLLDLAGTRSPYLHHGQSLVPHLRHGTPLPRTWHVAEDWVEDRHTATVISGCYKWLVDDDAGWQALFDVCSDPLERRDLAFEQPAKAQELRTLFNEVLDNEIDAVRSWRIGSQRLMGHD